MSRNTGDADGDRSERANDTPTADSADDRDDRLHQPEDEATEHALRLMSEALRQGDAGRRWLVSEKP